MDVEHFNPHLPDARRNDYSNLFLASRHCNAHKNDFWPTKEEQAQGIRYLNPCEERDYDEILFEDPETFEIWSDTPAGRYHVRMMKLNSPTLIRERKLRHLLKKASDGEGIFEFHGDIGVHDANVKAGMEFAKEYLICAIPAITQKKKPTPTATADEI